MSDRFLQIVCVGAKANSDGSQGPLGVEMRWSLEQWPIEARVDLYAEPDGYLTWK
jgi:hypothetical protein